MTQKHFELVVSSTTMSFELTGKEAVAIKTKCCDIYPMVLYISSKWPEVREENVNYFGPNLIANTLALDSLDSMPRGKMSTF